MKLGASLLLLAALVRHYAWEWFPPEVQAFAWNACSSAVTMALVWVVARDRWSPTIAALTIGWAIEEAQVFGCSVARMFWHWNVLPGQEQCSAPIGFKIGAFTILAVAVFLATCKSSHVTD